MLITECRFHYDYFMKKYPEARLLFTDTDSLYYFLETADLEKELYMDKHLFDYHDYNFKSPYLNYENQMAIGKFKCETRGASIVEFIGLAAKMYSYVHLSMGVTGAPTVEKQKVKGVTRATAKHLKHQHYADQLREHIENYLLNRRIGAKKHIIYSYSVKYFDFQPHSS